MGTQLGIWLVPSTAYHPRTDGQCEIANKVVEQYLRHYIGYHQDDWEPLLALAEYAYNSNDHVSSGMSPFKANYGFDPTFTGIPIGDQCLPAVADRMRQIT
jgi:hypothetical protein